MAEDFSVSGDLDGSDDASIFDLFADIIGKDSSASNDKMLWESTLDGGDFSSTGKGSKQSKKRKVNPDAETIAAVTEEALRELDLDPDSQDAKKKRRQIRNRLSAQFHRDRKNAYIKTLEETLEGKNLEIAQLQQTIIALRTENELLKQAPILVGHNRTDSLGSYSSYTDGESIGSHSPHPSDSPLVGPIKTESRVPNFPPLVAGIDKQGKLFSAPLFKSLAVLSVLCIICVTTTMSPTNLHSAATTTTTTNLVMEVPSHALPAALAHHGRRLIEDTLASTTPTTTTLTILSPNQTQTLPYFPTNNINIDNATVPLQRNYLRRSYPQEDQQQAHNNATQNTASKDLIPFFYHSHHQALPDWYFNPQAASPSLSYSHIVLNNGLALFDPALQLVQGGHQEYDGLFHSNPPYSFVPDLSLTSEQSTALTKYHGHSHVVYNTAGPVVRDPSDGTTSDGVMNGSKKDLVLPGQDKHWPALASSFPTHAAHAANSADPSNNNCGTNCELEKKELLAKLLSNSNLITVSLPASAVRLGKTFSDSRDGTMEGLLQMFNLTSSSSSSTTEGTTIYPKSIAEATIEMDCILLNAKLVMTGASTK